MTTAVFPVCYRTLKSIKRRSKKPSVFTNPAQAAVKRLCDGYTLVSVTAATPHTLSVIPATGPYPPEERLRLFVCLPVAVCPFVPYS